MEVVKKRKSLGAVEKRVFWSVLIEALSENRVPAVLWPKA